MFPVFASTHNAIISVSVYIALPLFLLFNYFLRKEFLGCYLCFANLLSKFPCHTYFYSNYSWIWCSHFLLICWGFNSMTMMPQRIKTVDMYSVKDLALKGQRRHTGNAQRVIVFCTNIIICRWISFSFLYKISSLIISKFQK